MTVFSIHSSTLRAVMPGLMVLLGASALLVTPGSTNHWASYADNLAAMLLQIGPALLLLAYAAGKSGATRWILSICGLAAWPAGVLFFTEAALPVYIALWLAYGLYFISAAWSKNTTRGQNYSLSLDSGLFWLTVALSFISAVIVNSHEGGFHNQPIPLAIDIARNLTHLPALLGYWVQLFTVYVCLYGLYYLNHHLLIERVLGRHGVAAYLFSALAAAAILYPVVAAISIALPISAGNETLTAGADHNPFNPLNFITALAVLAVSLPLILAFQWQEKNRHLSELQSARLQAELLWLQQQINPHFFFNALNNLYALVLTKSEKAPDAVLQLSNLFRFVVYKGNQERVKLSDEYTYLENYVALQRLRLNDRCTLEVTLEAPDQTHTISPLLLVVFVENAFKHGPVATDQEAWIRISATTKDNTLTFICENSIHAHEAPSDPDGGVGLQNVQKRLALQYENRHKLCAEKRGDRFYVNLSLKLDQDNGHDQSAGDR